MTAPTLPSRLDEIEKDLKRSGYYECSDVTEDMLFLLAAVREASACLAKYADHRNHIDRGIGPLVDHTEARETLARLEALARGEK